MMASFDPEGSNKFFDYFRVWLKMWFLEIKFYWSIFAKSAPLKINPNHFSWRSYICCHGNSLSKWFHKNHIDSLRILLFHNFDENLTKFSGCRKIGYDIIFNIDGSASIGEDDFEKIKRWGFIWPWLTSNDLHATQLQ